MNKLIIYRGLNVFAEPEIDLQTEFNEVLMGVDEIVSNVISSVPLLLEIDDYTIFRNENYFIDSIPEYTKIDENTHQYSIKFLHPKFRLNADFIQHLGDTTFTYFGDATAFLTLLLGCIHTLDTAYQLGEIEPTEQLFISFDGNTYLQALGIIAEAFNLEYSIRGKEITLKKQIGTDTNLTFEYGRGKGLYSLTRKAINDENVVNKVYGFGSSQNIDYTYRNGAKRLTFEGGFLTATTPYGVRAGIYTNEEIKPERTVEVTGVEPIVGNGFAIYDTTLDFDIRDYFQEGLVGKVIFKSGELSGQQFEITGYNHLTKKISLSTFTENDGYILPNATFMVQEGDLYTLVDMNQPVEYVVDAENRLQLATQAYLNENKIPKVAYDLPIDPKYIRTLGASLRAGDLVTIIDDKHGVDHKLRIIGVRLSIADETQIVVTIANFVPYTFEERVIASAINNQKEIKEISRTREEDAKRASMNIRTLANSIFDTDGLFDSDKINVGVLSAALGIFGVQSQNFSISKSLFKENYGADENSFQITNGLLIHREIEIVGGGSTWVMDGVTVTDLVSANLYYVYAKISKSTLTGAYLITTDQIKVEDQVGHYVLLTGVLYPVFEGTRDYDATHGVSTISGGRIQTGEISSLDGFSKWNLDTGSFKLGDFLDIDQSGATFKGSITVLPGGNAETKDGAQDKANAAEAAASALANTAQQTATDAKSYIDNVLPGVLDDIYDSLDGLMEQHFEAYDALSTNLPASSWTTPELKESHLGDLFYNTDNGKSWRWVKDGGGYFWQEIVNSDLQAALDMASKAQDTADAKRRVFTVQPFTPYDVGDMWVQGTSGDIMRCATPRIVSQIYVASDWVKASKYTDDTVASAAALAASNAQTSANSAITNAATANTELAKIANDNILMPTEKQDVLQEWQIIQSEKPIIEAQATTYAITTLKTAYTNAYNALSTYITPLLSNIATESAIVGTTFRTNFKNYYDAKVTLLKAVSDAAKVLADAAQASANSADSKATAAATAASNAQTTANTAVTDAATANSGLAKIANDNLLVPSEKQDTKKEWDIIVSERSVIIAQAGTYSIATTAYTNAYNALSTYITPLLANLTTDSVIVGATFRTNFKNYYDAKVALLKLISDKAKTLADAAQASANTADSKATAAATAASNAQTSANTANTELAKIANDNLLVPSEKQDVLKERNIIQGEYPVIIAQAGTYSIATATYTTAYNTLISYLSPLLSSMTTDSAIVGATFRTNFKNYYDAKVALLKLVSDAAKGLVDGIEVGGRNLFSSTKYVRLRNSEGGTNGNVYSTDGSGVLTVSGVDSSGGYEDKKVVDLKANSDYIFTFSVPINDRFAIYDDSLNPLSVGKNWNSEMTQLTLRMGNADGFMGGKFYPVEQEYPFDVYLMVEKGNKATDWSPAPEDVTAAIAVVQGEIDDVQGELNNLDIYVDGAFKDNVISSAEAKAIEKYLNSINTEKSDVDNKYTTIYANTNLTGTAKSNLLAAKNAWNTAHTNLITSINTAISGGTTTPAQKADVDSKFTAYRNALALLAQRFEQAADSIAQGKANVAENNALQQSRFTKIYRVNTLNPLPLVDMDGSNFNADYSYEVIAKTTGTESVTTAIACFINNGSGVFTLNKIYERGDTSNHPEFFLNSGIPSVRLYGHATLYEVEISTSRYLAITTPDQVADSKDTQIRTDLRLTAPLPSALKMDADGFTATLTGNPNAYARLNGQGLLVVGGAVDIRTSAVNGMGVQLNALGLIGYDNVGVKSFELNAATGEVMMRGADVQGKIEAESGKIGNILIYNNGLFASYFQVDGIGKIIARYGEIAGLEMPGDGSIKSFNSLFSVSSLGHLIVQSADIGDLTVSSNKVYVDGLPLIIGNKINASLIVADELIADKIRTATTGVRIEMNMLGLGEFYAYDASNVLKTSIENGILYATDGEFTGKVTATSGEFNGTVYATDGEFTGEVNATSGSISGSLLVGTIDANNVNIINLVANNIKTATTGQRIEILQSSNDLKMYNSSSQLILDIAYNNGFAGQPGIKINDLNLGRSVLISGRGLSVGATSIESHLTTINGKVTFHDFNNPVVIEIYKNGITYTGWSGTLGGRQVVNGIVT